MKNDVTMSHKEAHALVRTLFAQNWRYVLQDYEAIRFKPYRPKSWLQEVCYVAAGGKHLVFNRQKKAAPGQAELNL